MSCYVSMSVNAKMTWCLRRQCDWRQVEPRRRESFHSGSELEREHVFLPAHSVLLHGGDQESINLLNHIEIPSRALSIDRISLQSR